MLPSFLRINLWVAVLFAATVFSAMCLDSTEAFTTPSVSISARSPVVASSPCHVNCLHMAAVTEAPSKTKTDTNVEILKDQDTEKEQKSGKNGWEIQLFNDPFNHRTFVAKCLCTICGKSDGESYQIMMQAHKNGMGVVGRYHYEIAELYYGSLKKEGLTVRMVEVDEE